MAGRVAPAEEEVRKRILDLARAELPAPADLVSAYCQVREESFAELRALRADEAEERLEREVSAVASEVEALEEGAGGDAQIEARKAIELGEKVRWLLWLSQGVSGERPRDPLSFLESEMDWVERSARDLRRWDRRADSPAEKVLQDLDAQRSSLVARKFARFLENEGAQASTPLEASTHSWLQANESFSIEAEAALKRSSGATGFTLDLERLKARRRECLDRCQAFLGKLTR